MNREELIKNVAPCGLICYTCTGCGYGVIKEHAHALRHYLEGVPEFLETIPHEDSKKVDICMEVLDYYSSQTCSGCRDGENQCTIQNCIMRKCIIEKGIDFCGECADFPCNKLDFPQVFMNKWRASNTRIKEVGAEQFFNEEIRNPHFLGYKGS